MIAYFDTSALVPLLIGEPGSEAAGTAWDRADRLVSVRLIYVEARAALAQAARASRITKRQLDAAAAGLEELLDQVEHIEVDDELVRSAAELAETHALRAYDAVHLAAAIRLAEPDVVLVAGDRAILTAASNSGVATADVV